MLKNNSVKVYIFFYILSLTKGFQGFFIACPKILKVPLSAETIDLDERHCHFWILHRRKWQNGGIDTSSTSLPQKLTVKQESSCLAEEWHRLAA